VNWQVEVDALAELQGGLEFPDHFHSPDAARTGEEFDANAYFDILDHLSMEPGYVLDYVYCNDLMGGYPVLYARPDDQERYMTCSDYKQAENYLDHVRIDDTEEGFFQFVVLHVVGKQFYLHWHANYDDDVIICNREALETVVQGIKSPSDQFSNQQKRAALAIDPTPVVEMGEDVVTVQIVTFTNWGGFERVTFKVSRDFPHQILESTFETLVEYDCGIMF
jgi:hypothetical protein